MNSETHARVQKRVNRVAGQVGGIQKMVAEGRYCVDILNQIAAARSRSTRSAWSC
jgi:DNA-binding FrmR family transcriptional regulator